MPRSRASTSSAICGTVHARDRPRRAAVGAVVDRQQPHAVAGRALRSRERRPSRRGPARRAAGSAGAPRPPRAQGARCRRQRPARARAYTRYDRGVADAAATRSSSACSSRRPPASADVEVTQAHGCDAVAAGRSPYALVALTGASASASPTGISSRPGVRAARERAAVRGRSARRPLGAPARRRCVTTRCLREWLRQAHGRTAGRVSARSSSPLVRSVAEDTRRPAPAGR